MLELQLDYFDYLENNWLWLILGKQNNIVIKNGKVNTDIFLDWDEFNDFIDFLSNSYEYNIMSQYIQMLLNDDFENKINYRYMYISGFLLYIQDTLRISFCKYFLENISLFEYSFLQEEIDVKMGEDEDEDEIENQAFFKLLKYMPLSLFDKESKFFASKGIFLFENTLKDIKKENNFDYRLFNIKETRSIGENIIKIKNSLDIRRRNEISNLKLNFDDISFILTSPSLYSEDVYYRFRERKINDIIIKQEEDISSKKLLKIQEYTEKCYNFVKSFLETNCDDVYCEDILRNFYNTLNNSLIKTKSGEISEELLKQLIDDTYFLFFNLKNVNNYRNWRRLLYTYNRITNQRKEKIIQEFFKNKENINLQKITEFHTEIIMETFV